MTLSGQCIVFLLKKKCKDDVEIIATAVDEGRQEINRRAFPDLVFLDIEMPG
jgi:CheY-like chemotaxis protein